VPRKPLALLFGLVGVVAGVWVVRHTAGLLRREPGVSSDLLTRPWVEEPLGLSGVVLEAPWHL
jgi:hypothetical protein